MSLSTPMIHKFYYLTKCDSGHYSQSAFACDPENSCISSDYQTTCNAVLKNKADDNDFVDDFSVELFPCERSGHTIQYSMLCDFISDCSNSADEKRCFHDHHPPGFR